MYHYIEKEFQYAYSIDNSAEQFDAFAKPMYVKRGINKDMNTVVLVGNIPKEGKESFARRFQGKLKVLEAANATEAVAVPGVTYLVVRGSKYPATEIARLPESVKMISRWGVGYDSVDVEAAGKRGIAVSICTGGNSEPVAELAVLLMLATLRRLPQLLERAKKGRKDKEDLIEQSYLLQGKTVGLLGMGNIGSKVARMVQGFGSQVQYYDVLRMDKERERAMNVAYVDFDTLLYTSDIISVHVPLLPSTQGMIGAESIAKMKKSAILINTARGPLVDTDALLKAVNSGEIFAAALDTVTGEPLPPNHPIFHNDRIILTPHAGGNTVDNIENMVEIIANCILTMESGMMPAKKFIVNSQYLQ